MSPSPLFPVPVRDDAEPHVYISVGHQQMMTDPMRPLGLSLFQLTALPPMYEAAGRLFVDVTARLTSPSGRAALLELIGRGDPRIADALQTVVEREGFLPLAPADDAARAAPPAADPPAPIETDPAIVAGLIERTRASVADAARTIEPETGPALFDAILADIAELKRLLVDPLSSRAVMAGMEAAWWLNDHLVAWLGEKGAADTLAQSVPGNITSEMGLALFDVADAIRPHSEAVAFLERVVDDGFLDELAALPGGGASRSAIESWLAAYGMRCIGEIDITRPRWIERPSTLLPLILGHVRNVAAGERHRRFEHGQHQAKAKERELLERLAAMPDGAPKVVETKRMIDRLRTFAGYREYPKFGIVCRYLIYRQALLAEAERLVGAGVLHEPEDASFLTFQELREAGRTRVADAGLIAERRWAFDAFHALTPPRVLTSEGWAVTGSYRREGLPADVLVGLAVSRGTVEGRARVIADIVRADIEPGDILVTAFTDPSWAPMLAAAAGLVTEVGGLMTHGAVVAREYGMPAVVGVDRATERIRDGQRIRLNGTDGSIELLG